ncbi:uncharacterized protein RCC_01015 [Ramularia collo-cygni]|uniref:Uncharacterized protein n=1 Tax=Ramularia collo-cygni TaxID=112498 RepID=A0A2D3UMC9_9PEZI|nr:uncharacterized protein RCC_01015 [Ramularia collo-cygni]CZT15121.1 uncharacterized protein RCC_01015 [Ramularia collo-cygni]
MFSSFRTLLFALVAACLMLSAFATPEALAFPDAVASPDHNIEKRAVTIPLNQQRCISHKHGLHATYDIRVGRTFTQGHCDALWRELKNTRNEITVWSCRRLRGGHMRIIFNNTVGWGDSMNRALAKTFPHIGRVMPFRCNGRA